MQLTLVHVLHQHTQASGESFSTLAKAGALTVSQQGAGLTINVSAALLHNSNKGQANARIPPPHHCALCEHERQPGTWRRAARPPSHQHHTTRPRLRSYTT
jgi:hypothetical protein